MEEKLKFLATRKVTRESCKNVMDRLFPAKKDEKGNEESTTRRNNILVDILNLYADNDGNQFPEQRGTAYSLLNAVTNYTDHSRSTKGNMRAESALFGSGDKLKGQAYTVLLEEAQRMPAKAMGLPVAVIRSDAGVGTSGEVEREGGRNTPTQIKTIMYKLTINQTNAYEGTSLMKLIQVVVDDSSSDDVIEIWHKAKSQWRLLDGGKIK